MDRRKRSGLLALGFSSLGSVILSATSVLRNFALVLVFLSLICFICALIIFIQNNKRDSPKKIWFYVLAAFILIVLFLFFAFLLL
jgi:drug/metabolite transporter (DMT)-like permease